MTNPQTIAIRFQKGKRTKMPVMKFYQLGVYLEELQKERLKLAEQC